jgi:hypothetical protein
VSVNPCDWQHIVELGNGALAAHEKMPPIQRNDAAQHHALYMKVIRGCFEPFIAHMTAKRARVGHYGDRKPHREPETEEIRFTTP